MTTVTKILGLLGFDDTESAVYFALLKDGHSTAGKLARRCGLPRSSLYGILERLTQRGLVGESLEEKVKVFVAEPPEKIHLLFNKKTEELQEAQDGFRKLLPELKKKSRLHLRQPKLEMFQGADGLQSVLKDMLLYHELDTFAFWPIQNMLEVLSPEFFRYLNKERIRNNLYTRAVWPASHNVNLKNHPYLGVGKKFQREIRIAPAGLEFPMGYWCYGSKTAFISSQKESFGFLIDSEELSITLKVQFDILWNISAPLVVNEKDTEAFLQELERYEGRRR